VASRLHRSRRLARPACAALGIASCFVASGVCAQQAAFGDLGLRGELTAQSDGGDQFETSPAAPPAEPGVGASNGGPGAGSAGKPKATANKNALLRLQPYKGAQRLDQRGGPRGPADAETPPPSVAALPTPSKRKRPRRDDRPFDPTGIEIGDLKLTPFVEEDLGWSSNPGLLPGPRRGSGFLTSQAGFGLDSDWSKSAVHGSFVGGLTDYFADRSADAPFANGVLDGRWDVSRALSFDAEGRLALAAMTAGSLGLGPNVAFAGSGAPLTAVYGGTMGALQKLGRLELSLHASLDRTAYQDATLSDGRVEQLSSDNFNDWGLRGRATYAVSPELKPFVDVDVDTRRYSLGEDAFDYQRNSDGVSARIGVDIELTHVLTGSLDVGYGARNYEDPRLPRLESPLFDASLIWTPTALTTVTLRSISSLNDTTIRGASGAAQHATTLEIAHALRRYLTLTGAVSTLTDAYVGVPLRDATTTFSLAASYSLNRGVVLKASASRQFYSSNQPGTNYTATVLMIGLKLQR
jgi:hypothetical protein